MEKGLVFAATMANDCSVALCIFVTTGCIKKSPRHNKQKSLGKINEFLKYVT